MPHFDGIAIALITIGLIIAITSPFLTRVQLHLPPPKTAIGRGFDLCAGEILAGLFILGGVSRLLDNTSVFGPLHDVQVMVLIFFVMTSLAGWLIDGVVFKEDEEKRKSAGRD